MAEEEADEEDETSKPITETKIVHQEGEGVKISIYALAGVCSYQTLRLVGHIKKGSIVILIDSGSTHNLLTYFMSLLTFPKSVACKLERILRNFLWEGKDDEVKFHLVNWNQVCVPIHKGSLGIRKLEMFNKALLGKWLWLFGNENGHLWREVI